MERNTVNTTYSENKIKQFWKKLGPGLITGAADDDPSGIATYSQTGAQFGYIFLWMAVFTLPCLIIVQEMCARIGISTGKGLAENIKDHYPKFILYLITLLLFAANTFNISADLNAMTACIDLIAPRIPSVITFIFFIVVIATLQIFLSYKTYSKYLKYTACILCAYIFSAFLSHISWSSAFKHTFLPIFSFNKETMMILCAILGTTISPYLFFWQTSQEIEEKSIRFKKVSIKKMISNRRFDLRIGMVFSNVIMFFIIAASAATLHKQGITHIETAVQAAKALKPFAGRFAEGLFILGILAMGFLSIPVLAGSSAYAIANTLNWKSGLCEKWYNAVGFYSIIVFSLFLSLIIYFFKLPPMKGLVYSAFLNGLIAPLILFFIVRISSNKKIMGKQVNHISRTVSGWIITLLMFLSTLLALWFLK